MDLVMTGLDHNRADIATRELFALTKEKTGEALLSLIGCGSVGGSVIISTCNRTELYASVPDAGRFSASEALCGVYDRDYYDFGRFFIEKVNEQAIDHLCRVASGIDSQIIGDDQIITQAREALELSRAINCTDSYLETMFKFAIKAAKAIKTSVILRTLGLDSVPGKTIEKLAALCSLAGRSAVVIGNGQIGRMVSELLIRANMDVIVTLREYKKGVVIVPDGAGTISYGERYRAIEQADIVVSATSSPHFTVTRDCFIKLQNYPEIIVDLAVPRDIEPSIKDVIGVNLITIDDITSESRKIPPDSAARIDNIVNDHIDKYNRWKKYKENIGKMH